MAIREKSTQAKHRYSASAKSLFVVVIVLLIGASVRLMTLDVLKQRQGFDDAYYALNAVSLIDQPRFTPFFSDNLGRESGWMYFLIPFLLVLGETPFAVHFASAYVSILSIAAVYRLSAILLRRRGGLWAAATFAFFFNPVAIGAYGYRALTYPLVGALALAFLLEALREHDRRKWILCGLLTGLLAYTYFSARILMVLFGLIMVAALFKRHTRQTRPGAIIALGLAVLIALPQAWYTLTNFEASTYRIIDSARLDPTSLATNLVLWLRTPFISGDQRLEFNLPGRPLFDIANGVLWGVGLLVSTLAARRIYRRGWYAPLVFILAVSTVLPSLISNDAPNIVRAIGIFVPSAVFAGAGATWIETTAQRRGSHTVFRAAQAGLAGMVAISGVTTVGDMQRWIAHPGQYYSRHQQTHEAADYFKANLSPDTPVYFNPEELNFEGMYDAVIRFRAADLRPRHVGAADTRKCFPLPDVPAGYTAFETPSLNAHFQEVMQPWAQTRQLYQSVYVADSVTTYTQTLYLVTPLLDRLHPDDEPSIRLGNDSGDLFELRPTGLPEAVRAGDSITVTARFRMLRPASYDYRITLSLLNDPEDSAGRNHWAEQDDFICSIYGSTKWQANETIIRTLSLQVPADAPSGRYALVLRTYGGEPYKSVEDLHVTAPTYDDKYEGRYYHPLNVTGTRTSLNDDVTALELTAVDGYIREWWLIGGFPGNALDDDVLTGGEADYRVPDDGQGAVLIRSRSSKIDLTRFVRPVEQNVAYLFAWIKSPDDRKGFLGMNSDDSIAAWLNGEEVWRNKVSRYMPDDMRDIDLPPIELKKGWNALLIKVDQNTGEWAFKARVLNPDGSVMHDVEVATRRQ